uniref:Uncharacterized protein n=1 Tax=viral metagenome TaxID=1070528 RepID=A0A6H1ZV94_9ZZZZ
MIHLFCGGRSSLNKLNEELDGLKVVINFGFLYCKKFDILFWGDTIVGDKLKEIYIEKPSFKLVALEKHGGKASDWVDEYYAYKFGVFTTVWALMWLRERYDDDIYVYGLDGDGIAYYDKAVEQNSVEERIRRLKICYSQLDALPKAGIYNMNLNSPYKGFEFCR